MQKILKDDEVIIITGKDKGRRGKVLRVLRDKNRAVVESINIMKKHIKPNPQANQQGGIVEVEAPIHLSNVAIYNPTTDKADRVGIKRVDNKKVRYFKSNNEIIDV